MSLTPLERRVRTTLCIVAIIALSTAILTLWSYNVIRATTEPTITYEDDKGNTIEIDSEELSDWIIQTRKDTTTADFNCDELTCRFCGHVFNTCHGEWHYFVLEGPERRFETCFTLLIDAVEKYLAGETFSRKEEQQWDSR
jgi:hypothetical protein